MGWWRWVDGSTCPRNEALEEEVLREGYESCFASHPESTKMYKDLKAYYW
jgi:hypothetical protein